LERKEWFAFSGISRCLNSLFLYLPLLKRIRIISPIILLLLFVTSIGHDIIPHIHHDHSLVEKESIHHHHDQTKVQHHDNHHHSSERHEHDSNVDFLSLILGGHSHSTHSHSHQYTPIAIDIIKSNQQQICSIFTFEQESDIDSSCSGDEKRIRLVSEKFKPDHLFISSCPQRGPPSKA
jgi:hypothetical protein